MGRKMLENRRIDINKAIDVVENVIVILSVVIFTLNYNIVGVLKSSVFSPLKNIIMIAIFLLFIYRFFTVSKEERKEWFTDKFFFVPSFVWLLMFFAVRLIAFISSGFDYGVAREVFFEFVFLVAICRWTVGKNVRFEIAAAVFIFINLITNIGNTYCVHVIADNFNGNDFNKPVMDFISELSTYLPYGPKYNNAVLYVNPNSAGIMTGFAIIISLIFWKYSKIRPVIFIYWIYSLYVMIQYDSRGAVLSFLVSVIVMILMKVVKWVTPKRAVVFCMIISACTASAVYIFIGYNLTDGDKNFTQTEEQVNMLSTGRYKIWQDCYISHIDEKLFGEGSPAIEKETRNQYLLEEHIETYGSEDGFVKTNFSVHNGYLATVFITGWLGFILFLIIMADKICKAKVLSYNKNLSMVIASIVIYTLIVSNFEALLVTSRYYTVLMSFIVLAWDKDPKEREDKYGLE